MRRHRAALGALVALMGSVAASSAGYAANGGGPGISGGSGLGGGTGTAGTTTTTTTTTGAVTGTAAQGGVAVGWGGSCLVAGVNLVGWPLALGNPPSNAVLNAGIQAGTVVISPAPLPGGGNGYTWACYPAGSLTTTTTVATPPTPPASFNVGNVAFPAPGTVVLDAKNILVTDTVTATLTGGPPGGLAIAGVAPPNFQYEFDLRWMPKSNDQWNWQDGPLTSSNTHTYMHVSGSFGIPDTGVTVSAEKYWVPQCKALITQGTPPALTVVLSQDWGNYPCNYPPGQTAATYVYVQKFIENSPPAPHQVTQFEPVGG